MNETVLSSDALELIAARFRLLSEPTRLNILHALGRSELNVSELVEATGLGQTNVSRHLATLLNAGIVTRRREGLKANYRVTDPTVFEICELVCTHLKDHLIARQNTLTSKP